MFRNLFSWIIYSMSFGSSKPEAEIDKIIDAVSVNIFRGKAVGIPCSVVKSELFIASGNLLLIIQQVVDAHIDIKEGTVGQRFPHFI